MHQVIRSPAEAGNANLEAQQDKSIASKHQVQIPVKNKWSKPTCRSLNPEPSPQETSIAARLKDNRGSGMSTADKRQSELRRRAREWDGENSLGSAIRGAN